ncbi:MAG: IS110 family transposase [Proteobacteria bacterium]|nr:IS110 family transposase [Pseudomonadota bacterium]
MQTELSQFTAIIGLDWADKKHDVCVQATASGQRKTYQIQHKAEKIDAWARALYRRYGGPIAVALELSKGPIVSALQKYDFFVIFPIDPTMLANYRKTFTPSGAKDDPTDAELALDLLLCHPDHFQPLKPQSVEMRTLMTLVEQRRRLMNDRVRLTNRLRNALKQYYPQALEWFDRIDTPLFCDFIKRWPSLAQARRARKATLEKFFHEHHMYRKTLLKQRVTAIKSAVALTTDDAVIVPFRLQALTLVAQLEVALESIRIYDDEIAALAPQHPDYDLFRALPGAGPLLAPRLLVAFGEQRERFTSAAELQKYAGIAPVTERSGQKHWIHWRWQCPTCLRQTFVEWAAQTINKSYWAGLYYYQQRAKGSSYQAAVRALAFKWIRILYRCWVTRTPYDEAKYLKALKDRGSPLLMNVETA